MRASFFEGGQILETLISFCPPAEEAEPNEKRVQAITRCNTFQTTYNPPSSNIQSVTAVC